MYIVQFHLGTHHMGLAVRLKQKAPLGWQTEKQPPWFSLPPDLVGTEIEQLFLDFQPQTDEVGGWSLSLVTQLRLTDSNWRLRLPPLCPIPVPLYQCHHSVLLYNHSYGCATATVSQKHKLPCDQLFVISCRFSVSIKELDGWSLRDIFALSGHLSLKSEKWKHINQISETVTPK